MSADAIRFDFAITPLRKMQALVLLAVVSWLIVAAAAFGFKIYVLTPTHDPNFPERIEVNPKVSTSPAKADADDPAIWIHPTDPAKSVIIGTAKGRVGGGLCVWDLDGRLVQHIELVHPNNVDVRYGMQVGDRRIDIAVVNMRRTKEMKVYEISDGRLADVTTSGGIKTPELITPYGICLYRRPSDGAMFVIQSTAKGATENLHQYRLEDDGTGKIKGTLVRIFGNNTIKHFVEGLVADDELGYVYASDESRAVRKYYADPDRGNDDQIVAFATDDGIIGEREGLAIYKGANGTGYLLLSSQHNSTIKVYRREGDDGDPHKHSLVTTIKAIDAIETDGLDVTNRPISKKFPNGFLVAHSSPGRQFNLYAWEDVAQNYLRIYTGEERAVASNESSEGENLAFESVAETRRTGTRRHR
jgi:3-phytase